MAIRIEKLRNEQKERNNDAFLSFEPLIRRYLSGFTGSNSYAVISEKNGFCYRFSLF